MQNSKLFSPITLGGLTIRNRIGVSPMCQYSSDDGFATDWHLVHIGARASGGAGLIIMEATAVVPEGRITPACLGIWKDEHIPALTRVAAFAKSQGTVIGIQLAHAGRKASMDVPANGGARLSPANGGWQAVAPSPIPFAPEHAAPTEMSIADIEVLREKFVAAALRAVKAGFQVIEIHGAHGYLLHEFLSPLSNKRADQYGGSLENRMRLIVEIAHAIRAKIPSDIVLGARLSCVDWTEDGLKIEDSVKVAAELKKAGVDFIDCSSGFVTGDAKVPFAPGFQVPFARAIREGADIPTLAVGMITDAEQAEKIIADGGADMVLLAREFLRDPSWPLHAAVKLGMKGDIPVQYLRGY